MKGLQRSLLGSRTTSAGNRVQPLVDRLRLKLAPVRALASLPWIECRCIPPHYRSLQTPRRDHPFHSLPCLPGPVARRSLRTVLYPVLCGQQ